MGFVYPAGTFSSRACESTELGPRSAESKVLRKAAVLSLKENRAEVPLDPALAIANRFMKLAVEKGLASVEDLQR
jgi:hypothetical protein